MRSIQTTGGSLWFILTSELQDVDIHYTLWPDSLGITYYPLSRHARESLKDSQPADDNSARRYAEKRGI